MINAETELREFCHEAVENGEVWLLIQDMNYYASKDLGDATAVPFWSTEERATDYVNAHSNIEGPRPALLKIGTFIDNWLKTAEKKGHEIGINWCSEKSILIASPEELTQAISELDNV